MIPRTTPCAGCAITAARDHFSRRDFLSIAALSAVAATLTACGDDDGGSTGPISPGVGEISVRVTDFPALATVGGIAKVRNSPPVALTRTSTGLVAMSLSCTHQGTTVTIEANGSMYCPNHGARFTSAGIWTGGERTRNLVRLPVVLNADGVTALITLG